MATTSEQYINEMYDKQKANTLSGLENAYKQNVSALDASASKIPQEYYDQKREVEGNAEVQRRNINEIFNANGLNTGAIGQANLAMSNQKSANLAALTRAQADAEAEIGLKRANLETEYKNAVNSAIATSDYNRAQALYAEYQQRQSDAKGQVDALIKAGVMPSDELIAESGYRPEYVRSLYSAVIAAQQPKYSSGGGNPKINDDDDDDDGFSDGGDGTFKFANAYQAAAASPSTVKLLRDKNVKEATRKYQNGEMSGADYNAYIKAMKAQA